MSFLIVTKDSQKSAILPVRSAYKRQFDVGTWTELRIGMFFSITTAAAEDAATSSENSRTISSAADHICFGIKDSSTNLPRAAGSVFFGATSGATNESNYRYNGQIDTAERNLCAMNTAHTAATSAYGVTSGTTTALTSVSGLMLVANTKPASSSTGYSSFWGVRFVITDLGLATQTIDVYTRTAVNSNDTTVSELATQIDGAWTIRATAATANDGSTAYTIPNCFYLQNPFTGLRFKLHNHMIKKYA